MEEGRSIINSNAEAEMEEKRVSNEAVCEIGEKLENNKEITSVEDKENHENWKGRVEEKPRMDAKHDQSSKFGDMKEELQCHGSETNRDSEVNCEKNDENLKENQQISEEKKAKTTAKQPLKGKHTVPQPFSLATERRTSRERKNILEQSSPKLSKSHSQKTSDPRNSLRKMQTQTSLRLEKVTELKPGTAESGATIRKPFRSQKLVKVERNAEISRSEQEEQQKEPVSQKKNKEQEREFETKESLLKSRFKLINQVKGRDRETETETKKSPLNPKHNVEDLEIKLKKGSTFKASPLPSFYSRRSTPPKPEQTENSEKEAEKEKNKMQKSTTFKAVPLPSFYQKKASPADQTPDPTKSPLAQSKSPTRALRSKSLSRLDSKKMDMTRKTSAQIISDRTKETIKNLFRGPWKAPLSKHSEPKTATQSATADNGHEKGAAASIEGNNNMAIAVDA